MRTVKTFPPGSPLTAEYLDSLARAIIELQGLAVVNVQSPLTFQQNTLGAVIPAQVVLLKVTSAINSQGGRYKGKLIYGFGNASASGNLTATDLGSVVSDENLIVWDLSDLGTSAHSINLSDNTEAIRFGCLITVDQTSKLKVVLLVGGGKGKGFRKCNLTDDGTGNGGSSATTYATYKYTFGTDIISGQAINNADGSTPAAQEPNAGTRSVGEWDAATVGEYYINPSTGNPILWKAYEHRRLCTS